MSERFFHPLGITNTRFLDRHDIVAGPAAGYTVVDGEFRNNRRVWQFELTPHFGVLSSIDDMIRWERGLVRGDVIPPEVSEEITAPYRVFFERNDHRLAYGMGWQIHDIGGRRIIEHAGYTGTIYLRDLTTGLSVIVLTNRDISSGIRRERPTSSGRPSVQRTRKALTSRFTEIVPLTGRFGAAPVPLPGADGSPKHTGYHSASSGRVLRSRLVLHRQWMRTVSDGVGSRAPAWPRQLSSATRWVRLVYRIISTRNGG